ncbi:hypothetical protein JXA88_16605 [Candidatus Fermentibacteria bacterium]|nr:hypothetical protein [Candidatus Fermentibacteria bacterium]
MASCRANVVCENSGRARVFGPAHPGILVSVEVAGTAVQLTRNAGNGATEYWIYGGTNEPFYEPQRESPFHHRVGITPDLTWLSPAQIGDEATRVTYPVLRADRLCGCRGG